jgi:hypothetical protein
VRAQLHKNDCPGVRQQHDRQVIKTLMDDLVSAEIMCPSNQCMPRAPLPLGRSILRHIGDI